MQIRIANNPARALPVGLTFERVHHFPHGVIRLYMTAQDGRQAWIDLTAAEAQLLSIDLVPSAPAAEPG